MTSARIIERVWLVKCFAARTAGSHGDGDCLELCHGLSHRTAQQMALIDRGTKVRAV